MACTFGKVAAVAEFDERQKAVRKYLHQDGYFYPPIVETVRSDLTEKKYQTVPKTKRPAHLYRLPASHELQLTTESAELNIREGSAAFVIHLLAFLLRTRLQFSDWYFDGRVPIGRSRGIGVIVCNESEAAAYLSHGYNMVSMVAK